MNINKVMVISYNLRLITGVVERIVKAVATLMSRTDKDEYRTEKQSKIHALGVDRVNSICLFSSMKLSIISLRA